jgi:hypothetical protein
VTYDVSIVASGALMCLVHSRRRSGATPVQARRGSHVVRLSFYG